MTEVAPVGTDHLGFAVPLHLRTSRGDLRLMTTVTSFATAVDVTLAELKLGAFLPADEATAAALRAEARAEARSRGAGGGAGGGAGSGPGEHVVGRHPVLLVERQHLQPAPSRPARRRRPAPSPR
ncbi:hypothetical protein [Kitasatospora sp. NPDC059327]|uniref:hypothetical protein n=1 Tax=Kitasatospora sp. NPDC059327 TaxID=3346803 RepID=UPI0036870D95